VAKLIFGMMASLDGYVAGNDPDAMFPSPEESFYLYFQEHGLLTKVALYGRGMYEMMQGLETVDADADAPASAIEFSRAWKKMQKIVISTTLKTVGPNARLVSTDVEEVVRALKRDEEGDIAVAGPKLARSLAKLGLIDEYRLYLLPFVLGGGEPFFEAGARARLRFLGTESLPEGVVLVRYDNGYPMAQPPADIMPPARLLCYAIRDKSIRYSGCRVMFVGGEELKEVPGVAIVESHEPDLGRKFWLLYCDQHWKIIGFAPYESVEDAKRRAELMYPGILRFWGDVR
jgi:dihydrofolate reductase